MFGAKFIHVGLRNPSMIGCWRHGTLHSNVTFVSGVKHETIICESVIKQNAQQANNCLTTKKECHMKDSTVTEVTPVAQTLSKSGAKNIQQLAWKDFTPKVTAKDVHADFDIRRKTTDEEDKNFQSSKRLANNNYSFRKPNVKETDRYNENIKSTDE